MSKLEQLIDELCPNGVEYVELNSILDYEQPTKYIVETTNYDDSFETPVLTAGQTFVLGYTNETGGIYISTKENPTIIFDDFTTSFHWVDFSFKIKSSAMKMLRVKLLEDKNALLRYIYHCMKNIQYQPVDHSRQWIAKYSYFRIPLPPLPVQEEIVRILDNFTELTAELTAELRARKKQYEYYRESLLTFGDGVPMVQLKAVVKKSCSGATPNKGNSEFYTNGSVPWLRTQEVKFNEIYKIGSFITEEAVRKTSAKWIPTNCVIVAISGATAGRCAINKIPTTTNQHCYNMEIDETKALYKYVFYCVCSQYEELLSRKQGARGDLNSSLIMGIYIPLPSLPKQRRIVEILDRFDILCNDISSGLPAEIKARQKQYEYYRDKLLTFPKAELEV
ncbi:restriction endonuclease subunit S [Culicoidibacter larvae]|uniref:Restriction endonuclease subunit S n=1 Tax=Culicoidibacter larvae TaxID=2579976 RepID=A0A5R8QDI6_9FIRM|nr:restriction endonuclease subunit S [Culicoidibacter larvae]TLG75291.1 restriction endonuclease subunit S [Culicoidibacter larvae]